MQKRQPNRFNIHRKKVWDINGPCTPEADFLSRRRFIKHIGAAAALAPVLGAAACSQESRGDERLIDLDKTLNPNSGNLFRTAERNAKYTVDRPITDQRVAGAHNNFYEFTASKARVWRLARGFKTRPWTVEITGQVKKPITLDIDDIVRKMPIEERIYRLRCVEAWAITVPWTGFPLKALLDLAEPTSRAKFVRFITFHRPKEAPGQQPGQPYTWPYYEALTIDEAVNELTLVANGIYGHELPNQHGAPIRLIVPWKYGYKSIKSVVRIELTETQPPTFWNDVAPREYDFWSNVNPAKPHPRWSQATEALVGEQRKVPTMPYNGYGDFVHQLYKGTPNAAM